MDWPYWLGLAWRWGGGVVFRSVATCLVKGSGFYINQGMYMSSNSVHSVNNTRELYTEATRQSLMHHIVKYFGEPDLFLSERVSPDICVEIAVIEPTPNQNFYTLITLGMGAHKMNVPEDLADQQIERGELVMLLDPDWEVPSHEDQFYWPIRLLKTLARQSIEDPDVFLSWGYRWSNGEPFCEETELNSIVLNTLFKAFDTEAQACHLPDGDIINYYFVWPLYQNEYDFLLENGREEFMNAMTYVTPITINDRDNGISSEAAYGAVVMEDARWHAYSIESKKLKVEPLSAANHLAIYLRFAIENDLMCEPFQENASTIINQIKTGEVTDLRHFIRQVLNGILDRRIFNSLGMSFNQFYFSEKSNPMYAKDVDSYSLNYFGVKRYYSGEFQDEAYLFVPFTEEYYQNQKQIIEQRFHDFINMRTSPNTENFLLYRFFRRYLGTQSWYIPGMNSDCIVSTTLRVGHRQMLSSKEVPVIIELSHEIYQDFIKTIKDTAPSVPYANAQDAAVDSLNVGSSAHNQDAQHALGNGLNQSHDETTPLYDSHGRELALNKDAMRCEDGSYNLHYYPIAQDKGDPYDMDMAVVRHFRQQALNTPPVLFESTIFGALSKLKAKIPEVASYGPKLKRIYNAMRAFSVDKNADADTQKRQQYLFDAIQDPLHCSLDPEVVASPAVGKITCSNPYDLVTFYQNIERTFTKSMIAIDLPVARPWEVFAYMPYGCRKNGLLPHLTIAMAYHFYIYYGAMPAIICKDSIEFCMGKVLSDKQREQLMMELTAISGGVYYESPYELQASSEAISTMLIRRKSFTVQFNNPTLFK